MKNLKVCLAVVGACLLVGINARGQATRTWVSGVGDDANPCSRTAPCKTFAGAIAKTAPGGEIDALDPGGFGALTITKAITLDGGGGQVASVLVAGTNGIVVAAQPSDVVILRNLAFDGLGPGGNAGLNGIRFIGGKGLHIEHCTIFGFGQNGITDGNGIDIEPAAAALPIFVSVVDTTSVNNAGSGLKVLGGSRVFVTIDRSRFEQNRGFGVLAADFSRVTVRDSDASENNKGFVAEAGHEAAVISIANSTAGNNVIGIQAGGSTLSIVRLTGVSIFNNSADGLFVGSNGSIESFGNNYNAGNGFPTSTILPQ